MVARECMPSTMQATASGSNPALVYQACLSAGAPSRLEMTRRQRSYPVAPPGLWDREDMRSALAARDMGAVITIFRRWTGASQTDIGVLLGMPQPHVSDFERGIRHATSLAMFERLADGLGIPRPLLGLADSQHDYDEAWLGHTREEPSRGPDPV